MPDPNRCAFATQVTDLVADQPRRGLVFGLVVHCSGRSKVNEAIRLGVPVLDHLVAYYRPAAFSAHYVLGYQGDIVQVTADDRRVPHVGIEPPQREAYLSGRWRTDRRLVAAAVNRWRDQWFPWASPQHLFPGSSPNGAYVGCELPPLAKPTADGLWYTLAQHLSVAALASDLRARHGWPSWATRGLPCQRLLGHEDLDAYERWDKGGGWDPGALRAQPRFSWKLVQAALQ